MSEESVLSLNAKAIDCLHTGQIQRASFMLNQALSSLNSFKQSYLKQKLLSVCYHNLGLLHKTLANYQQAATFLAAALKHEKFVKEEVELLAGTHLDYGIVLSALGKHKLALNHCLKSLKLLRRHFEVAQGIVDPLIVAYYNAGIQFEYLKMPAEAIDYYLAGYYLAVESLGLDSKHAKDIKRSLMLLQAKMGMRRGVFAEEQDLLPAIDVKKKTSHLNKRKGFSNSHSQHSRASSVTSHLPSSRKETTRMHFQATPRKIRNDKANGHFRLTYLAAVKIQRWWRRLRRSKEKKLRTVKSLHLRKSIYRYGVPPEMFLEKIVLIQRFFKNRIRNVHASHKMNAQF